MSRYISEMVQTSVTMWTWIWSHMRSIKWFHSHKPYLEGLLTQVSQSWYVSKARISKTLHLGDKVTIGRY